MSKFDYEASKRLVEQDPPFAALIMAAMRKADSVNARVLRANWPALWEELQARYNAPGGILPHEMVEQVNERLDAMAEFVAGGSIHQGETRLMDLSAKPYTIEDAHNDGRHAGDPLSFADLGCKLCQHDTEEE